MTEAIAIHGHDIIDVVSNYPDGIRLSQLMELVGERYGQHVTFHTCSALGMDLDGLLRFLEARDKVLLVEFLRSLDAEALIPRTEGMARSWHELDDEKKAELIETLIGNPVNAMDAVKAFLQRGVSSFHRRFPFVATTRHRFFRQYIEDLDSLRSALEELKDLATQTGRGFELSPLVTRMMSNTSRWLPGGASIPRNSYWHGRCN